MAPGTGAAANPPHGSGKEGSWCPGLSRWPARLQPPSVVPETWWPPSPLGPGVPGSCALPLRRTLTSASRLAFCARSRVAQPAAPAHPSSQAPGPQDAQQVTKHLSGWRGRLWDVGACVWPPWELAGVCRGCLHSDLGLAVEPNKGARRPALPRVLFPCADRTPHVCWGGAVCSSAPCFTQHPTEGQSRSAAGTALGRPSPAAFWPGGHRQGMDKARDQAAGAGVHWVLSPLRRASLGSLVGGRGSLEKGSVCACPPALFLSRGRARCRMWIPSPTQRHHQCTFAGSQGERRPADLASGPAESLALGLAAATPPEVARHLSPPRLQAAPLTGPGGAGAEGALCEGREPAGVQRGLSVR